MALSTRRMSGMVSAAGPGGQALLETLDAFKRKHVSQNKEIIHKNSELMKANAELSKQLRDAQNELMSTRSECSGLKTTNYHLQVKVAKLKEQLSEVVAELQTRGERRGRPDEGDATEGGAGAGGGRTLPTEDVQTLRNMLALACSQLQAAQQVAESFAAIVPTHQSKPGRSGSYPQLPPVSPPTSPPSLAYPFNPNSFLHLPPVRRPSGEVQPIVSAPPDLSYISEGSAEANVTAVEHIHYDDEIEYSEYAEQRGDEVNEQDIGRGGPLQASHLSQALDRDAFCHGVDGDVDGDQDEEGLSYDEVEAFLQAHAAASRQSSVEPEYVQEEIEALLVAESPLTIQGSEEDSTCRKEPKGTREKPLNLQGIETPTVASSAPSQHRRRNSGVLPPPPRDLQSNASATSRKIGTDAPTTSGRMIRRKSRERLSSDSPEASKAIEQPPPPLPPVPPIVATVSRKRSRPSLLDDLGVSPSQLSLSSLTTSTASQSSRRRDRSPSPANPSVDASTSEEGSSLGRTVRHSNSVGSLRDLAREGGTHPTTDPAALTSPRRASSAILHGNAVAEKATSVTTQRKRSIHSSMQGRPAGSTLVTLDGQTQMKSSGNREGSQQGQSGPAITSSTQTATLKKRRSAPSLTGTTSSTQSVRTSSKSGTTVSLPAASAAQISSALSKPRRSTTPEVEPPLVASTVARSRVVLSETAPATISQPRTVTSTNDKRTSTATSRPTKDRSKAEKDQVADGPGDENVLVNAVPCNPPEHEGGARDGSSSCLDVSASSSSANNSTSSAPPVQQREGRRARSQVSYQEPSLNKKMRQPAGYVPTIKTVSSMRNAPSAGGTVGGGGVGGGVRRKSTLPNPSTSKGGGSRRSSAASSSMSDTDVREYELSYDDDGVESG